jgi:hypothetical protein
LAGTLAVGIGALMALPSALPASAAIARPAIPSSVRHLQGGTPVFDVGVHPTVSQADVDNAVFSSTSFPHFRSSTAANGVTYPYTMAGVNPGIRVANATSTIRSPLVPVVMNIGGQTFDPTAADSCDPGASALARTQGSPIYNAQPWTMNGASMGRVQLTDAFQRANFWHNAKPGGTNPTYNVNLARVTLPKVTINVPNAAAGLGQTPCGNGYLGAVDIGWLDNYLQTVVIPSLAPLGVNGSTFPIFLVHNVVEFVNTTSNCCVLGYHNAYKPNLASIQTYSLSEYDNSTTFGKGVQDISALSHEVAEWMDDPYVNNPTPSWGHTGQVPGCQSNLEVGDPLSGTVFSDPLNGYNYHPQELAFFSWFYHQSPSVGAGRMYSDRGTFRTFAAPC